MHQRKAEGESQRQFFVLNLLLFHETGQTVGDVVEQLLARTQHYVLGDGENFRSHFEMVGTQFDEENAEIRTAQIQGQEFTSFCNNTAKVLLT